MFRFPVLGHLRRVERYAKYERKTILLASYLHDFILFLLKKKKILVWICVIYVSSVKYIKILTSISSTTDNFDGTEYTDVVRKVENFIILPLFHIVSATEVCDITIFYKMQI